MAVGGNALLVNTTGANNVAVGLNALDANTTAEANVAIGTYALTANTTTSKNTAVGTNALSLNTGGSNNTAVGNNSLLRSTSGGNNVAIGHETAVNVTTGSENTFVGVVAGEAATTGSSNTFIGRGAGGAITTGQNNTIIGRYNGNAGGLDIRTSSNNIVLSDGDGNVRAHCDSSGNWSGIGGGKVLQVVQAIDQINRSMTFSQDVWHTVPNLTATITPSSTSSKILMMVRIVLEWDAGDSWNLNYAPARNGTQFNTGVATMSSPATNSQNRGMGTIFATENNNDTFTTPEGIVFSTIDSPNTTSATSYTVQMINTNNGGSIYFNSTVSLSNPNAFSGSSEIILMEIGA